MDEKGGIHPPQEKEEEQAPYFKSAWKKDGQGWKRPCRKCGSDYYWRYGCMNTRCAAWMKEGRALSVESFCGMDGRLSINPSILQISTYNHPNLQQVSA